MRHVRCSMPSWALSETRAPWAFVIISSQVQSINNVNGSALVTSFILLPGNNLSHLCVCVHAREARKATTRQMTGKTRLPWSQLAGTPLARTKSHKSMRFTLHSQVLCVDGLVRFWPSKVCKSFLVGLCPYDKAPI